MRAILDSGYLFALANVKDRNHERAAAVAEAQKAEDLILPTTVLTEAAYLIHSRLGHRAMREFVLGISNSPVQFQSVDDAVGEYPLSPALSPTRGERGPESLRGGS
ncbi:MAG: hypothetical protein JXB47_03875, partial [Anaerolineae bacterium]|nr:hypothetical protein [Anaerolineae bacterium]